jgi:hypothetical protein
VALLDEPSEPDEVPAEEQMAPPTEAMPAPEPASEEPDEAPLDFPDKKPKDDKLWFEQKPERDFDFDD